MGNPNADFENESRISFKVSPLHLFIDHATVTKEIASVWTRDMIRKGFVPVFMEMNNSDRLWFESIFEFETGEFHKRKIPKVLNITTKKTGEVYFLEARELSRIKIGYANDSKARVSKIAGGQPPCELTVYGFIPGTLKDERRIHKQLSDHRIYGEWFNFNEEVRSVIDELINSQRETNTPSVRG